MTDAEIFSHCQAVRTIYSGKLSLLESGLLDCLREAEYLIDAKEYPVTAQKMRDVIAFAENIAKGRP